MRGGRVAFEAWGESLDEKHLRDLGLGRREEGVPEVTRDKLSLPVNYIYVDWALL